MVRNVELKIKNIEVQGYGALRARFQIHMYNYLISLIFHVLNSIKYTSQEFWNQHTHKQTNKRRKRSEHASNKITVSDTVMRVNPPSTPAAPIRA